MSPAFEGLFAVPVNRVGRTSRSFLSPRHYRNSLDRAFRIAYFLSCWVVTTPDDRHSDRINNQTLYRTTASGRVQLLPDLVSIRMPFAKLPSVRGRVLRIRPKLPLSSSKSWNSSVCRKPPSFFDGGRNSSDETGIIQTAGRSLRLVPDRRRHSVALSSACWSGRESAVRSQDPRGGVVASLLLSRHPATVQWEEWPSNAFAGTSARRCIATCFAVQKLKSVAGQLQFRCYSQLRCSLHISRRPRRQILMSQNSGQNPVGRGAADNPANRFLTVLHEADFEQLEFDEEFLQQLARPVTRYFDDSSKSVISENDSPDIPFRYSLNPYRGCLHGCSYCYARPSHEYLGLSAGLDFETKIFVKRNAPSLFRDWLARPKYQCEPVMLSGVTDCYQPIERKLQITRQCLEVALEARQPMSLITKNSLMTRDVDLLSELAAMKLCKVAISINSLDQGLTRVLEPACTAPAGRLEAIRKLAEAGIPVHVMVAPIIHGLNDNEMPAVLNAVAEAGARSASHIMVRLPLSVETIFIDWIKRHRPTHAEKIESRLRAVREGKLSQSEFRIRMRGTGPIADQISALFNLTRQRCGLDATLPASRTDLFKPPRTSSGQMHLF